MPTRSCACSPASASTISVVGFRRGDGRGLVRRGPQAAARTRRVVRHTLDMVPLPLSSSEISRSENPAIMLGRARSRSADRRHLPDDPQQRQGRHPERQVQPDVHRRAPNRADVGRGGASSAPSSSDAQDPPLTAAGRIDADIYWDRITYFLKRVVPVAEEPRSRLRVIRRIRACRKARAGAASTRCSARWMA